MQAITENQAIGENDVLYSFRRCPYAMRARLALFYSGTRVQLREVVLRNKPEPMLEASPKGTVPVLVFANGEVIEESLDVMLCALGQSDPHNLIPQDDKTKDQMMALIGECDGPFKSALDRYKYPNRYENVDPLAQRNKASDFLMRLNELLTNEKCYFFGPKVTLSDIAILPFVRQFANVDRQWFDAQDWKKLISLLDRFMQSEEFLSIMEKYSQWHEGDAPTIFGAHLRRVGVV